jgi:hypothetical protein
MYLVSYDWVMNAPLRTIQIQRQNDANLVVGVLCCVDHSLSVWLEMRENRYKLGLGFKLEHHIDLKLANW